MHIANPIYDVIFKYMLEDDKVAKLFSANNTYDERQEKARQIEKKEEELKEKDKTIAELEREIAELKLKLKPE